MLHTISPHTLPKGFPLKAPENSSSSSNRFSKIMVCTATNTVRRGQKLFLWRGAASDSNGPVRGKPTNTKVHCGSREDIARLRQIPPRACHGHAHLGQIKEWVEGFSILLHIPTKLGCLLAELMIGVFPLSAKSLVLWVYLISSDN